MKTLKKTLLQLVKITLVFTLFSCLFSSCSKDDDNNLIPLVDKIPQSALRTYNGGLSYTTQDGEEFFNLNGTATLSESSNGVYTISFSDNIPSIQGISFDLLGLNSYGYEENNNEIYLNVNFIIDYTLNGNLIEFTGF